MIWTELICSNFIIVRLLPDEMLAQHGSFHMPSRNQSRCVTIPLATFEALHKVEHSASCRCCL